MVLLLIVLSGDLDVLGKIVGKIIFILGVLGCVIGVVDIDIKIVFVGNQVIIVGNLKNIGIVLNVDL